MKILSKLFYCLNSVFCFKLSKPKGLATDTSITRYIPCNQVLNDDITNIHTIKYEDTMPFIPPVKEGVVVKVYDGDTITIASRLPIENSPLYRFSVRLAGIDCPEIKTNNNEEKIVSIIARNELTSIVYLRNVRLENVRTEKYGRLLADVYFESIHLNKYLLDKRLAVKYEGKTKISPKSWTNYYYKGIMD